MTTRGKSEELLVVIYLFAATYWLNLLAPEFYI
jgi:hypothetical protein